MHEAQLLHRQGKTITEIAVELGKSERSVYYYLSSPPEPAKNGNNKASLIRSNPTSTVYWMTRRITTGLSSRRNWSRLNIQAA
ncbi:MAG: hypothetical protein JW925_12825 [Syntrophaceae bacterium]|nr:hypothetical protein [Syntrophaceae bacterium]